MTYAPSTYAPSLARPYGAPEPRFLRLAIKFIPATAILMGLFLFCPFFPDGESGVPSRLVFMAAAAFGGALGYVLALLDRGTWK